MDSVKKIAVGSIVTASFLAILAIFLGGKCLYSDTKRAEAETLLQTERVRGDGLEKENKKIKQELEQVLREKAQEKKEWQVALVSFFFRPPAKVNSDDITPTSVSRRISPCLETRISHDCKGTGFTPTYSGVWADAR